jgi:limonene-1,2-epoxide hydrolase
MPQLIVDRMTTATTHPKDVMTGYFNAWRSRDFDALQELLGDDVTFAGPFGETNGATECRKGIEGLSKITTDIDIKQMCAEGENVMTWFDLHTSIAAPTPVVNWSRVVDGRIVRIRATFDSRVLRQG